MKCRTICPTRILLRDHPHPPVLSSYREQGPEAMARETYADVHKPRWLQGCADPKHLEPKSRLYV